jgi:serine/threonine-protein kinase RsbW
MHLPAARPTAPRIIARIYCGIPMHIRQVRSDLHDVLADCPVADDVLLCASELATNAVRHSRSGLPGGTFTVQVAVVPGSRVRIEVRDEGGWWAPALANSDRRHGFDIVGALAADWAIEGDDGGRTASAVLSWTLQSQ